MPLINNQKSKCVMNAEQFVEGIKLHVRNSAVDSTLEVLKKPLGRRPSKESIELSEFYNELPEEGKIKIESIVQQAAHFAIFGFLCVLDGARFIESDEDKGSFELRYINGDVNININEERELHDILNAVGVDL